MGADMQLRQGIVVATHPEDYSVDLVMLDDGSRVVGAQVMTMNGSARSGSVDLPDAGKKKDKWDISEKSENDQIAIVAFMRGNPVVMGFIYPQISQMTFGEAGRRIDRHQSDVFSTVDKDGNTQFSHPGGAYVRVGADPREEKLTGKNFDKNFRQTRNTDKDVRFRVGNKKFFIELKHDGELNIAASKVSIVAGGTSDEPSDGTMTIMDGAGIFTAGSVVGKIDVSGGGVSLTQHRHLFVTKGEDKSGTPESFAPTGDDNLTIPDKPPGFDERYPTNATTSFKVARAPDGRRFVSWDDMKSSLIPTTEKGVHTDEYGNVVYTDFNKRYPETGEQLKYVRPSQNTDTAYVFTGNPVLTDRKGAVVENLSYEDLNERDVDEFGIATFKKKSYQAPVPPGSDPLPGNSNKLAWPWDE